MFYADFFKWKFWLTILWCVLVTLNGTVGHQFLERADDQDPSPTPLVQDTHIPSPPPQDNALDLCTLWQQFKNHLKLFHTDTKLPDAAPEEKKHFLDDKNSTTHPNTSQLSPSSSEVANVFKMAVQIGNNSLSPDHNTKVLNFLKDSIDRIELYDKALDDKFHQSLNQLRTWLVNKVNETGKSRAASLWDDLVDVAASNMKAKGNLRELKRVKRNVETMNENIVEENVDNNVPIIDEIANISGIKTTGSQENVTAEINIRNLNVKNIPTTIMAGQETVKATGLEENITTKMNIDGTNDRNIPSPITDRQNAKTAYLEDNLSTIEIQTMRKTGLQQIFTSKINIRNANDKNIPSPIIDVETVNTTGLEENKTSKINAEKTNDTKAPNAAMNVKSVNKTGLEENLTPKINIRSIYDKNIPSPTIDIETVNKTSSKENFMSEIDIHNANDKNISSSIIDIQTVKRTGLEENLTSKINRRNTNDKNTPSPTIDIQTIKTTGLEENKSKINIKHTNGEIEPSPAIDEKLVHTTGVEENLMFKTNMRNVNDKNIPSPTIEIQTSNRTGLEEKITSKIAFKYVNGENALNPNITEGLKTLENIQTATVNKNDKKTQSNHAELNENPRTDLANDRISSIRSDPKSSNDENITTFKRTNANDQKEIKFQDVKSMSNIEPDIVSDDECVNWSNEFVDYVINDPSMLGQVQIVNTKISTHAPTKPADWLSFTGTKNRKFKPNLSLFEILEILFEEHMKADEKENILKRVERVAHQEVIITPTLPYVTPKSRKKSTTKSAITTTILTQETDSTQGTMATIQVEDASTQGTTTSKQELIATTQTGASTQGTMGMLQEREASTQGTTTQGTIGTMQAQDASTQGTTTSIQEVIGTTQTGASTQGTMETLQERSASTQGTMGTLQERGASTQGPMETLQERGASTQGTIETLQERGASTQGTMETLQERGASTQETNAPTQRIITTMQERDASAQNSITTMQTEGVSKQEKNLSVQEKTVKIEEITVLAQDKTVSTREKTVSNILNEKTEANNVTITDSQSKMKTEQPIISQTKKIDQPKVQREKTVEPNFQTEKTKLTVSAQTTEADSQSIIETDKPNDETNKTESKEFTNRIDYVRGESNKTSTETLIVHLESTKANYLQEYDLLESNNTDVEPDEYASSYATLGSISTLSVDPNGNKHLYGHRQDLSFFNNGKSLSSTLVIPVLLVILVGVILFGMHNLSRYFTPRTRVVPNNA